MSYAEWIAENVDEPYGRCQSWAWAMAEFYPELRVAKGFYDCPIWGARTHWWCVTPDGRIIDPTAAQFPSAGTGSYREITDDSEAPTGACLDCGDFVFHGVTFCSDACARNTESYMAEIASGRW